MNTKRHSLTSLRMTSLDIEKQNYYTIHSMKMAINIVKCNIRDISLGSLRNKCESMNEWMDEKLTLYNNLLSI